MRRPKNKTVRLEEVVIDQRAQTRADGLDDAHVEQMVEDVKELPPMLVVEVGGKYMLADGFHRHAAYKRAKMIRVPVAVIVGTEDDWIDAFASANDDQRAKPRTRDDKRRSVEVVIELRGDQWSNVRIAEAAKVSEGFVRKIRKSDPDQPRTYEVETTPKREGKDGKLRPANIKHPTKTSESAPEAVVEPTPEHDTDPSTEAVSEPAPPTPAEPVKQAEPEPDGDSEQPASIDAGAVFVDDVGALCREMDRVNGRMKELKSSPFAYTIHFDSAISQVDAARKTIWQGRPAYHCPYCEREGEVRPSCTACKGTGKVKKTTYDSGKEACP